MEPEFWLQKWRKDEIGFHEGRANEHLVKHWPALRQKAGSRIFVPLCGKTRDIHWLRAGGHAVAGVELSEAAVVQLFAELAVTPDVAACGVLRRYSAPQLDIFVGDFFELSTAQLGSVGAVYDRAALIALPEGMRQRYADHLVRISGRAPQLLICFEYDPSAHHGPPFSVTAPMVRGYYAADYRLDELAVVDVPGGLKGKCSATERVWALTPR